jgi:hypothetical protein
MGNRTRLREKLTYANVMVTILAFIVLGGGIAYGASHLGKNSVGTKQLKKNSVTTAKIKKNAVTTAQIRNGAVNAAKVQDGSLTGANVLDGSLTGADINQASLNNVRAANITSMSFSSDASCSPTSPLPSGVSSKRIGGTGGCLLTFPNSIASCTANATVHFRPTKPILTLIEPRTAQIFTNPNEPNLLAVATYEAESLTNLPFDLVLVC